MEGTLGRQEGDLVQYQGVENIGRQLQVAHIIPRGDHQVQKMALRANGSALSFDRSRFASAPPRGNVEHLCGSGWYHPNTCDLRYLS